MNHARVQCFVVKLAVAVLVSGCVAQGDAGENEPCLPSQSTCMIDGRPRCIDPANDRAHCGACDGVCAEGDVCVQGRCASTVCAEGERRCEGASLLVCARDRTRFERRACPRGTRCEGAGRCVDTVASWPTQWMTRERDEPSMQRGAPWASWGGACGVRQVTMLDDQLVFASTSDRTFHGRRTTWPTEGIWAVEVRLRWHREATVRVMVGAYATIGESVAQTISEAQLDRDVVSVVSVGSTPRILSTRLATEQWHTIRFEAHVQSARMRWIMDGAVVIEQGMLPAESFGPYFVVAGYGPCLADVFAVGTVSIEEGM